MSETAAPIRSWTDIANPTRFLSIADRLIPWLAGLAALVLGVGLYMSFAAPEDYQQGITVRIMYLHVPFAWLAMFCYITDGGLGARHAGVAPSAGRRLAEGRGAARRGLHLPGARHRLDLGQADVGHLVGVGRAADLGLRAVPDVSRHHRADARAGRSVPLRQGGRLVTCRLRSTSRSSSSPSTGGTRCTSRPRSYVSTGLPSIRPCCGRFW
jgi:hypothetical protein